MLDEAEVRMHNELFFNSLDTPGMEKKAYDAINDYTRFRVREEGFWRRVMPPTTVTNEEIDRLPDDVKPVKFVDMEPDSPAAVVLPFGAVPPSLWLRGPRYVVRFVRVAGRRYVADVDTLRTWRMDIRQVVSDNSIKDILEREDSAFITGSQTATGAQDVVNPTSGVIQWRSIAGGITRDSLQDSFTILPSTPTRAEVNKVLVNNITIREIMKFGRDEMGGDRSQDILFGGWTDAEFMRATWHITIKQNLVPNNRTYMYADPKFIGKNYELEPVVMHVKREFYMLEFFPYELIGGSIGNTNGVAIASFV